ncbi:MAG: hypothetical protein FWF85_03780, partial [Clostridiales bacterium]|nr:hypothetical protein [Clostridiales bacterium]
MKLKKSVRKAVALFLTVVMLIGMVPVGPFAPKIAEAQMSTGQKTDANFVDIQSGSFHNVALDDLGRVYTWAYTSGYTNRLGRSGSYTPAAQVTTTIDGSALPFIKKISAGFASSALLDGDGNIWTFGTATMGRTGSGDRPGMVTLPGGVKAVDVSAANGGGRAIGTDGNIYVWGSGGNATTAVGYNLGTGASETRTSPVMLTLDNSLNELPHNFIKIESSDYFDWPSTIALTEDGKVYTWADNNSYTTQGGSRRPRLITQDSSGAPIGWALPIKRINTGNGFWMVLDADGDLWTWGQNSHTYNNHNAQGAGATAGDVQNPKKIHTVYSAASGAGTMPAPKFRDASEYAWGILAVDVNNQVYGCGQNLSSQRGSGATTDVWLRPFRPTYYPADAQIYYISCGYRGNGFIDSDGNAYVNSSNTGMRGGGDAAQPWVHLANSNVALFTSITSSPSADFKNYTKTKASVNVTLSQAASEVRYVVLYPEDIQKYTDGQTFWSKSFYEVDPPYFMRGYGEKMLASPNASLESGRWYANPKITEDVFEKAYEAKLALGEAGRFNGAGTSWNVDPTFEEYCLVWLQSKATTGGQTNRIILPYTNFYVQTAVYMRGVDADNPSHILYNPTLVPGGYGLPLTRDRSAIVDIAPSTEPPMGWDVVQPDPAFASGIWDAYDYWTLDPSNQTALQSTADKWGIFHRLNADKELILDKYEFYSQKNPVINPGDGVVNTVTFTYKKNPDKWANATFKYVYEDGTPVSVWHEGDVYNTNDDYRAWALPVPPLGLSVLDPYTPPVAEDDSDDAVGYRLTTPPTGPGTYEVCEFPDGCNPLISSGSPPPAVTIYIVYKKGLMPVTERFYEVNSIGVRTPITYGGADFLKNVYEPGAPVTRPIPHISGEVLTGFEVYKKNETTLLFEKVDTKCLDYVWVTDPDPFKTGHYAELPFTLPLPTGIDGEYEVRYLYKKATIHPDIPDDLLAEVDVYWYGIRMDGVTRTSLGHEKVYDLDGTAKSFFEDKADHFYEGVDPDEWWISPPSKYLSGVAPYLPAGSASPAAVTMSHDTSKTVYFYYNADINKNGLPDEDEQITIKYRIYDDYTTELLADNVIAPYLLGTPYTGYPPVVPGYHAVGWYGGEYTSGILDEDLHLIDSRDDYFDINYEMPILPNNPTLTIIYKKVSTITVKFTATTYMGTEFNAPDQVLTGLVGEDVTSRIEDPFIGNSLWIYDDKTSVVPVDGLYIIGETPLTYNLHYKENTSYCLIVKAAKSTDDKINFENILRFSPLHGEETLLADEIPNYRVIGWEKYDDYGVLVDKSANHPLDPVNSVKVYTGDGNQKVVFLYKCLDTTVYVKAVDAADPSKVLGTMTYYDAVLDETYRVRAFYVDGYALDDDLIKVIDPVLEGTNVVEFKYTLRDNVVIEFYEYAEGGEGIFLKAMNVPDFPIPRTYTVANLEAELAGAYYKFNAAATAAAGTTVPLTITEVLTEQTYKVYFDKIKVPVVIRQWDEDNDVELGRLYTYFTDPGDWLRAGEMATVATESVLGYTLTESSAKSVYVDPDSTELTPQVVTFKYRKNELGDVHVLFYYNGDESNVLEEFTTKAEVGSTFSVTATNSFPGFKLIEAETTKMIMVAGTNPTIKFAYEDIRKNVTVYTRQDDDKPLQADLLKFAEGDPVVILPPYVAGCMPIGYALDPADIENIDETEIVAIDSSFTGLDLGAIAADHEVVFIYVDYAGQFVILTVKGISGTSELYSYTTLAVNSDEPIEIEALAQEGYRLVSVTEDPANTDPREITPDRDQEIIFKYVSLATTVKIRMVNAAGVDIIPGFDVPAVTGGVLTYHAPNLPGYYLTDPSSIGKVDPVLAEGASEILFHYAPIVSKITIVAKENDKDGRIIKVVEVSPLGIGEYDYTAPDLAAEFYTPKASPNLVKINWDGTNAASGEAYYTKDLASVKVNKTDSATGLPIEGFGTVSGLPKGEAATIDAPILTGWVLIGAKSQTVVADGVNEVTFSYRTLAADEVQVKAIVKGTDKVLQSYVLTGTVNDKVEVKAPAILGWTLDSLSPVEVTIGTTKEAVFEYVANQVTVTVHKIHLSSLAEIGTPVEVKVAKGGDAAIYAPHIDGYVVNGDSSKNLFGIAANEDIYFFYDSIEEVALKYLAKITVVGQGDSGEILYSYDKLIPKNSGNLDIYAFNVKGYKLLDPSPVTV